MHQPQLPAIDPYVNRNLFSLHFLDQVLPQDALWDVDEDSLRLAMQAIEHLLLTHKEVLPELNEPQLEQQFVRPVLKALGHAFEVQPSLPTWEGVRRPDYALFASDHDRLEALRRHKGQQEYFRHSVAIADAKRWGRPLDKRQRGGTDKFDMLSPSWQIDHYLRISEVPWGVLTDGRFWRLYSHDTSFRLDVYYEIDLPQLIARRDTQAFKYFYLFFRRQAFIRDTEGLCFLDRVYQGSLEYARAVGDDLKENVYKALRLLAEGFLNTLGNDLNPQIDIHVIHENSLVYLYRLLFINYAEDRDLLPRDNRLYKETYGLVSMEREIASKMEQQQSLSPLQATYWEKLRALFDLVNRGSEAFRIDKDTLFVPPYNGGLFDPEQHGFLEENKVADRWLAQVIDLLARSKGEGAGRGFVDYTSLDVRHLGSIYEGLLEYKLRAAEEDMVAVKRRGREEWVRANEAEGKKVVETIERGGLYLATDRGERKATGSYYTPDYIVKYIVENTVGPLIEEKMKEKDAVEGILSLKVLDPAMGSGHFLVEATDRLAHALVEALGGSAEQGEEEDVRWARREVVERCIYGVDLNPLAVELAKLSLWLHTVAEGKPLNFLDHHLKVGNSLIGAWVDDLGSLPVVRKGRRRQAGTDARQMNLFEIRLNELLPVMLGRVLDITRRASETLEDIKAKTAADQAMQRLKGPFDAVADLWVSTYFGNEITEAEYQEALEHIGESGQLLALPPVKQAMKIAEDQRFFHWELEFPEVFHNDSRRPNSRGFDAVLGNPPWVAVDNLPEKEKIFFRESYQVAQKFDLAHVFSDLGFKVCRLRGYVSLVIPEHSWIGQFHTSFRLHLTEKTEPLWVVSLKEGDFSDVANPASMFAALRVQEPSPEAEVLVASAASPEDLMPLQGQRISVSVLESDVVLNTYNEPVCLYRVFFDPRLLSLRSALHRARWRYADAFAVVSDGVKTADALKEIMTQSPAKAEKSRYCRALRSGVKIPDRYSIPEWDGWYILRQDYIDPYRLRAGFSYDTPRRMYCFRAEEKMIMRQTEPTIMATLDREGYRFPNSIFTAALKPDSPLDLRYLLALMNSRLIREYYLLSSQVEGTTKPQLYINQIKSLPIRCISFTTPADVRQRLAGQTQAIYTERDNAALLALIDACLDAKPEQADVIHDLLVYLAEEMIEMNKEKQGEAKGFLDWLAGYTGLAIDEWRLKTIVHAYWEKGWDDLRRALGENRKAIEKSSGRKVEGRQATEAIQREFEKSVAKLDPLLERIATTDRLIDLIVYRLYGLTQEEIAIVEGGE